MARAYIMQSQKDLNMLNLSTQYHDCWCPGSTRSQGFSKLDIDIVFPAISQTLLGVFFTEMVMDMQSNYLYHIQSPEPCINMR